MNRRQRHDTEKHGREKTRILFCIRGANLNLSFNKHCAQQKPRTRTVNPSTRSAHKKHGFQLQTCKSVFAYMLNILSWFSSIISEITDIFMLFHNSKCQKAKWAVTFISFLSLLTCPRFRTNLKSFTFLRPNLKNLSGGLNLSRGLNMDGSTLNCFKCFKI